MNVTIIKEVWHGSWEIRLLILAGLITGLTANDIAPYILWMPLFMQGIVASYWNVLVLALVGWIRLKKTSSKLVGSAAEADSPEVVKAAKAALKETPEVRDLKARIAALEGDSPKA
jgi:hypothetical protein